MKRKLRNRFFAIIMSVLMVCQIAPSISMIAYADSEAATEVETVVNETEENDADVADVAESSEATEEAEPEPIAALPKSQANAPAKNDMQANSLPVSYDLADHIKTLEVIGDPSSVESGRKITVKFGWLIEGEVHGGTDTFTYQLPANFKLKNASTGSITKGEHGEAIGSYRVDTDGKVTIKYNSNYNTDKQTTINYMEITGEASYGDDNDGHQINFKWNGGSKVVVVTNPGDFTINKTATRKFDGGVLSHNSTIDYTVKIASKLGTNGTFTITDAISKSGGFKEDEISLIPSSFKLVDKNGKEISITPAIDGTKFTISDVPALEKGGEYTLKYTAAVALKKDSNGVDTYITNTVRAESGGVIHTNTKTVTYGWIMKKNFVEYNNSLKKMRWYTHVRTAGNNLAGYTFTDTVSDGKIFYDPTDTKGLTITLDAYDSNGTKINFGKQPEFKVNGNTFSFVFPDVPKASYFYIKYYTDVEGEPGTSLEAKNTSTLISKTGETWTANQTGKGVIQGKTTIDKIGTGHGAAKDGYIPFSWKTTITYDNVNKSSYDFVDKIQAAELRQYNGTQYVWNKYAYPNDHYTTVGDIMSGDMKVYIDDNGTERLLTEEEILKYVYIYFYSTTNLAAGSGVEANDYETHVKSFKISIKNVKPTRMELSYNTRFSLEHYANGTTWRMNNKLEAESLGKEAYNEYNNDFNPENGIEKQIKTQYAGSEVWTSNPGNYDYDKTNGQLTYRLLVTLAEGQEEFEVTDQLPEGFKLQGTPRVGPYIETRNDSTYGWEGNNNVSINYDEASNKVTVSAKNIGSALTLKDKNTVVIRYTVKVDENFDQLDGAVINSTGSTYAVSKAFTNTATLGDKSDSLTVNVVREQNVLSKVGEQVSQDGAYTSRVHYTVDVNPKGLDLLKNSDELTLTDLMSSTALDFKLDPTSIKLYDAKTNEEVEPLAIHIEQPVEGDGKEASTQKFTINVKDETAYRLEYDFIVDKRDDAHAATEGELNNTISLEGYAKASDKTEAMGVNVRATSNHAGLELVKVDADNNAKFLTATFKLEKYNAASGSYEFVENFTLEGEEGLTFDYYSSKCKLEGNTLYKITETDAPDGYVLDDTPFYFIIRGNIQDVRSGDIAATNLTVATEDEAKKAAGAPSGLDIKMLEPNTGSYFEIANTRAPATGKAVLEAAKKLEGRELKNGEFSFTVTENGKTVATGKNDADGKVSFSEIEYGMDDIGTHSYVVTEDAGNLGGVTYDESSFEVTVEVADNGTSTLDVDVTYPANGIEFTNSYDAKPTSVAIEATKILSGRSLDDGEFDFVITEGDEIIARATNDAEGKITFPEIEYKLSDVGTHSLIITEVAGDKGGVEYSNESYTVTVTVSDNGDGTLSAEAAIPEDGIVFHNGYEAAEAKVTLGAKKYLEGAELKDGQFSFELKDESGAVVETVQNEADGNIAFGALNFKEAGEYSYTVSEVKGNEEGITYDETIYTVNIRVTDDREGHLIASVDTEDENLVFNNKYTPTEKENTDKTSPKTGDRNDRFFWIGLMAVATMTLGFMMFGRRRKNDAE